MHYQVTDQEKHSAKIPHHIFNINVIITHLAISQVALEIGGGSPLPFLLVPIISGLVIFYLFKRSQQALAQGDSWFVAANWTLAWRRGRNLLISYAVATLVIGIGVVLGKLVGGGLMMNDFSAEGSSTSIVEKISLFFGAIVVFFTVLYNFLQTGISVYDAGKGIIDPKIEKFAPRGENANEELGEGSDEIHHLGAKQMNENNAEEKQ
ncbi:hypothetical protein [Thiomicrorhabdus sp. 6S3-12]|uniref:hypothetical protein n=1 Tax=Thiomicrorhabdus sp. 6S3-12 TaxID=2819681 RepID=UPI001AAC484B|nr:hypothetical protein [Thiomicrorhabdus sp. 6S3-12]MBO1924696.1 hypothetical protein [Thiomicrorhabdus sp. 6S3-12]